MSINYFQDYEADFYHWLVTYGEINRHSVTNYISWLKFLSVSYEISSNLSEDDINSIIESENKLRLERKIYKTERDMINFKSAMRKFRVFLNSDYKGIQENVIKTELLKLKQDNTISQTERISITLSRLGQGVFRRRLIDYWKGCAISNFTHYSFLIASHIKPWYKSSNQERLDAFNGLLLLPNYDKLFDAGYISFRDDGKIIFSPLLSKQERDLLKMDDDMHLSKIHPEHSKYLQYHRDNCFIS